MGVQVNYQIYKPLLMTTKGRKFTEEEDSQLIKHYRKCHGQPQLLQKQHLKHRTVEQIRQHMSKSQKFKDRLKENDNVKEESPKKKTANQVLQVIWKKTKVKKKYMSLKNLIKNQDITPLIVCMTNSCTRI